MAAVPTPCIIRNCANTDSITSDRGNTAVTEYSAGFTRLAVTVPVLKIIALAVFVVSQDGIRDSGQTGVG
jgi:hypothetical protein